MVYVNAPPGVTGCFGIKFRCTNGPCESCRDVGIAFEVSCCSSCFEEYVKPENESDSSDDSSDELAE